MASPVLPRLSVSDFVAVVDQSLTALFPALEVEGEVSGFRVSQNKWVFFDLKDDTASISCFLTVYQLRSPIEDGMKLLVRAVPKLTAWGKFSLTVQQYQLQGQGSLQRSFELLKSRLAAEGLFAPERKRPLPTRPQRIGVISSTQAAGYADFLKILNQRWGSLTVQVAHVQVQGLAAAEQIRRAVQYFNQQAEPPEVLVCIRGGGSLDDLAAFNDEALVRAIAASRVPTVVGVGHQVDQTLADLAADVSAATPSNAAQLVVPDKQAVLSQLRLAVQRAAQQTRHRLGQARGQLDQQQQTALGQWRRAINQRLGHLRTQQRMIAEYDPETVLRRGYALVRGPQQLGSVVEITTIKARMRARIENYEQR